MKDLKEDIEKIITYHSELGEGTSGYLLSSEQIDELVALFKRFAGEDKKEIVNKIREFMSFNPERGGATRSISVKRLNEFLNNLVGEE